MPKILYVPRKFRQEQIAIINKANEILEEYAKKGFDLTLRSLFYQFVARDLLPNTQETYKRLGKTIDKGRLAGLIDWDHIEDRTRNVQERNHFARPENVIEAAYHSYYLDRWQGQEYKVFCLIEKDALAGIFAPVCRQWDVPLLPCRGYPSQSEMWRLAMRLRRCEGAGQIPVIIHFGDHDPSGIDMTRDIQTRMSMFGCGVSVSRLALNMDQVEKYNPPPNPARTTDSRFQAYLDAYGDESWELDALDPTVLAQLVEDAINRYRDPETWKRTVEREIEERAVLKVLSDKWSDVKGHIALSYPSTIASAEDALDADTRYEHELGE